LGQRKKRFSSYMKIAVLKSGDLKTLSNDVMPGKEAHRLQKKEKNSTLKCFLLENNPSYLSFEAGARIQILETTRHSHLRIFVYV
jgi:hypothetical protein